MMNRMSDHNRGTRARHHDAQMALLRMIIELRITVVEAHENIGTLQRENIVNTIHLYRPGIQECYDFVDDILKTLDRPRSLMEERLMRHVELVKWLTDLSIDVQLLAAPDAEAVRQRPFRPISAERLDEGERLVDALDECRERVVWFR